jgi:flagellar biosynthesis component FlhA
MKYEIVYEISLGYSEHVVVKANNKDAARKMADAKRDNRIDNGYVFYSIRELKSVDQLTHEHEIKIRDNRISDLERTLRAIQSKIENANIPAV